MERCHMHRKTIWILLFASGISFGQDRTYRIAATGTAHTGKHAAEPSSPVRPGRLIDEIRSHQSGVAVWWTGHNGWLIKSDGCLMGTDLCLEQSDRMVPSPVSAAEIAPELDILFISHEHGDHFEPETARILSGKSDCLFVLPRNCLALAREFGIPENRIRTAVPRTPFTLNDVDILPMRAIHGNPRFAVFVDANLEDCGYLIKTQGVSLLQPGDTVLLEDHLFLGHVDVLFLSPTEHNTAIDRSAILINELEPDVILPQHRDTFRVTPENR
jgi:L-ascorbate metabolism protein UlaG (beta-lactamase superfamily)